MAKEQILGLPQEESEKLLFTFSLFANRLEVGTVITALASSKLNPSENYRSEGQLGFGISIDEAKVGVLGLVEKLAEKMNQKYTDDNPKHEEVSHFLNIVRETVQEKLHL